MVWCLFTFQGQLERGLLTNIGQLIDGLLQCPHCVIRLDCDFRPVLWGWEDTEWWETLEKDQFVLSLHVDSNNNATFKKNAETRAKSSDLYQVNRVLCEFQLLQLTCPCLKVTNFLLQLFQYLICPLLGFHLLLLQFCHQLSVVSLDGLHQCGAHPAVPLNLPLSDFLSKETKRVFASLLIAFKCFLFFFASMLLKCWLLIVLNLHLLFCSPKKTLFVFFFCPSLPPSAHPTGVT